MPLPHSTRGCLSCVPVLSFFKKNSEFSSVSSSSLLFFFFSWKKTKTKNKTKPLWFDSQFSNKINVWVLLRVQLTGAGCFGHGWTEGALDWD